LSSRPSAHPQRSVDQVRCDRPGGQPAVVGEHHGEQAATQLPAAPPRPADLRQRSQQRGQLSVRAGIGRADLGHHDRGPPGADVAWLGTGGRAVPLLSRGGARAPGPPARARPGGRALPPAPPPPAPACPGAVRAPPRRRAPPPGARGHLAGGTHGTPSPPAGRKGGGSNPPPTPGWWALWAKPRPRSATNPPAPPATPPCPTSGRPPFGLTPSSSPRRWAT